MLWWAERNLGALESAIAAFDEANPYGLRSDVDEKTGERRLRISVADVPHPEEWTFQIGDIAHNLRVALDYLAFGHAFPRDPTITSDVARLRNVMFPICDDRKDWPGTLGRLGWASDEMRNRLEAVQPFQHPHMSNLHPLTMLNRLDKPHKHQTLLRAAPNVTGVDFDKGDPCGVAEVTALGLEGPFEDGAVVARVRFKPVRIPHAIPPANVEMHVTFEVAFGEGCALNGFPAIPRLKEIAAYIRDGIFPVIEPVL
jgi:hypothetical protein